MPAEKDSAKRRRQARNRQERQKRQTRVAGARRSESQRPARTPDAVPTPKRKGAAGTGARAGAAGPRTGSGRTTTDADTETETATATAPAAGGILGKLFPPRPEVPAGKGGRPSRAQPTQSVVVDVDDAGGPRGWLLVRMSQPGGRPALLGLFVAIVSAVTLLAFPVLPRFAFEGYGEMVVQEAAAVSNASAAQTTQLVDTFKDGDPISAGTSRLGDVAPLAYALVFSLIPIAIAGLAVASLTKPTRSRTLLISALAAALYVFFSQGIGTFFILGVAALGFAAYKSRKADAQAAADAD